MTNNPQARLTARLRAHGLIGPGTMVRYIKIREGSRSGGWKWRAADALSGADLGIGSRIAVSDLYQCPGWELRQEELGLHVGPRDDHPGRR